MLEIRKKNIENIWEHILTTESKTVILSKGYTRILNNSFDFSEINGSDNIRGVDISNIRVYDETSGGSAESFPNGLALMTRLRELGYPYFDERTITTTVGLNIRDDGTDLGGVTSIDFTTNMNVSVADGVATVSATGSGGSIPNEHEINGTRITANISGTYNIDLDAGSYFDLTLTAATTLSDTNRPTGTNVKVVTCKITGDFPLTLDSNYTVIGDTYDGTSDNLCTIHFGNGTTGSEDIIFDIRNI